MEIVEEAPVVEAESVAVAADEVETPDADEAEMQIDTGEAVSKDERIEEQQEEDEEEAIVAEQKVGEDEEEEEEENNGFKNGDVEMETVEESVSEAIDEEEEDEDEEPEQQERLPAPMPARRRTLSNRMSTGKRLAKRSIIGTKVCAAGRNGIYYSGSITGVRTPPTANLIESANSINITRDTRYSVKLDHPTAYMQFSKCDFFDTDLIGPGFRPITDNVHLLSGQTVFFTYNGREVTGHVVLHEIETDEVIIEFRGLRNETMKLAKKLDEVRLLASRRSHRLRHQDTDFARLADMATDRKRQFSTNGNSHYSSSFSNGSGHHFNGTNGSYRNTSPLPASSQNGAALPPPPALGTSALQDQQSNQISKKRTMPLNEVFSSKNPKMDECGAALVLMSLGVTYNNSNKEKSATDTTTTTTFNHNSNNNNNNNNSSISDMNRSSGESQESVEYSTSPSPTPSNDSLLSHTSSTHEIFSSNGLAGHFIDEIQKRNYSLTIGYECAVAGCDHFAESLRAIKCHVLYAHLYPNEMVKNSDDIFYYNEALVKIFSSPTLSHSDMARPRHEDPEYQRQFVGSYRESMLRAEENKKKNPKNVRNRVNGTNGMQRKPRKRSGGGLGSGSQTGSRTRTYSTSSNGVNGAYNYSPDRDFRRVLESTDAERNAAAEADLKVLQQAAAIHSSRNGNGFGAASKSTADQLDLKPPKKKRTRGENKKCRKVYGMASKELWCTQCKWKKACARFND